MTKPFVYEDTVHGRRITCEVVDTWELNEGDALYLNGCFMVCGPFEDEVTKYGRTPEYDSKGARWCQARVVSEGNGAIPGGWFDRKDGDRFWTVQGNTLARWSRIVSNTPA